MQIRQYWRVLALFALVMVVILAFAKNDSDASGWVQERILGRGRVNDIVLSPNDDMLAVAGSIGVWLYRFPSLEDYAFIPHNAILQSVSWSPDGKRLATGDWDVGVRIWDVRTPTPRLVAEYQKGREVVWSPVDERLAVFENWTDTGYGDTVWVVEPESGLTLLRLKAQLDDRLWALSWSADGQWIAARSHESNHYRWQVPPVRSSGERVVVEYSKRVHSEEWLSLAQLAETGGEERLIPGEWPSPAGEYLLLLSDEEPMTVIHTPSGEKQILLEEGSARVRDFAWSKDGGQLAVVRSWGQVEAWELVSGERLTQRVDPFSWDYFREVAWSPDGTRIANGGDFGRLWVWDWRNGVAAISRESHETGLDEIVWSPDSAHLAALDRGGRLWIWDAMQAEVVKKLEKSAAPPSLGRQDDIVWSPDGKWFVVKDSSGWPWSYAWDTETWLHSQAQPEMEAWFVSPSPRSTKGVRGGGENLTYSSHLSPDGTQRALGKWDGTVILQDANQEETLHVFDDGWNPRGLSVIDSVVWSTDGRYIAAGGTADTLWIWDVASRELLAEFDEPAFPITSIAWSSDGLRLASTGWDGVVRIYRAP